MDVLDLYQVTTIATQNSSQIVNTYTYSCTASDGSFGSGAQYLANQWFQNFWGDTEGPFQGLLFVDDLRYDIVRAQNLFNPLDYYEILSAVYTGGSTGDPASQFLALSFRTPWLGPVIRRGQKRYGGLPEAAIANGQLHTSLVAAANDIKALLGTTLSFTDGPNSGSWAPCIVKRIPYTAPSGRTAYRLPTDLTEAVWDIVPEWGLNTLITSQNTRKVGRGA
jgi:hypothetical protein